MWMSMNVGTSRVFVQTVVVSTQREDTSVSVNLATSSLQMGRSALTTEEEFVTKGLSEEGKTVKY